MWSKHVIAAACAVAASVSGAAEPLNFDDEKAKIGAQLELIQMQTQLRDALSKFAGPTMGGLPAVLAIVGMDGRHSARLQHPNGVVATYGEGEQIRPGMVVTAITPRAVMVKLGAGKSAKAVPLEFVAGASGAMYPAGAGAGGGMPGVPPLPPELLPAPPAVRLPRSNVPALAPAASPAMPSPAAPAAPASATPPSASLPDSGAAGQQAAKK